MSDIEFSAPAGGPIVDDVALSVETSEEYQDEIARVHEEATDEAHDWYLARKVALMEAAGASPDEIVDALVDEFARGESW